MGVKPSRPPATPGPCLCTAAIIRLLWPLRVAQQRSALYLAHRSTGALSTGQGAGFEHFLRVYCRLFIHAPKIALRSSGGQSFHRCNPSLFCTWATSEFRCQVCLDMRSGLFGRAVYPSFALFHFVWPSLRLFVDRGTLPPRPPKMAPGAPRGAWRHWPARRSNSAVVLAYDGHDGGHLIHVSIVCGDTNRLRDWVVCRRGVDRAPDVGDRGSSLRQVH